MKQQTLAMAADQGSGFERYRKPTRRDEFLLSGGNQDEKSASIKVRSEVRVGGWRA